MDGNRSAQQQRSLMAEMEKVNGIARRPATATDAFWNVCDGVVAWSDVKKPLTYSSSSSLSSLGRAWSSSSSSASCFLLRVDIANGMDGFRVWVERDQMEWSESEERGAGPAER